MDNLIFPRIERTIVPEEISRRLLGMILDGTLQPGQKLPSESRLTEALGVSRLSLRAALHRLAALGMVESRQGSGHFIRSGAALERLEARLQPLLGEEVESLALQEARIAVEPGAVALAAQRATREDLRRMETALTAYEEVLRRGGDLIKVGAEVHCAFSEGCGNPMLSRVVRSLVELTVPLHKQIYRRVGVDHAERDPRDHRAIFEAIVRRAPQDAIERTVAHLGRVDTAVRQAILAAAQATLDHPAEPATAGSVRREHVAPKARKQQPG